jgi:hypothetical protein
MDTIVRWRRGNLLGGGAKAKNLSVLTRGLSAGYSDPVTVQEGTPCNLETMSPRRGQSGRLVGRLSQSSGVRWISCHGS